MNGFSVICREKQDTAGHEKMGIRIPVFEHFARPQSYTRKLGGLSYTELRIPIKKETRKLRQAYRIADRRYDTVVSKDYNINYSFICYLSMLVRALDFYSINQGCDLRLGEVVIADAATFEGMCTFKLMAPFARRILLVTEKKKELYDIAEKAIIDYGVSAAVIEDPVRAAERADAVVLASDCAYHKCLAYGNVPTLVLKYKDLLQKGKWFDNTLLCYSDGSYVDEAAIQGYLMAIARKPIWRHAELEGFYIDSIKQQERVILRR